jgi:hypothetical protein
LLQKITANEENGFEMKKILLILVFTHSLLIATNAQWIQMSSGLGNKEVEALSENGSYIFAGTLNSTPSGVYLSVELWYKLGSVFF